MILKKKEFFLLIILILLQSCSGGTIGNFLESSFENLETIKQAEESKDISDNKKVFNSEKKGNNKKIKEKKIKENSKNISDNKKVFNSDKKSDKTKKNNKIKNFTKKNKIELQSYKIIFILKDVDPKDPTEELSNILRNSEVNFEIEKIERILDSKNKSMNKN